MSDYISIEVASTTPAAEPSLWLLMDVRGAGLAWVGLGPGVDGRWNLPTGGTVYGWEFAP